MTSKNAEEWRVVPAFPRYEVSDLGRMRNAQTGKLLKVGRVDRPRDGYARVGMVHPNGKTWGVRIHTKVAEAFLGPRLPGYQVNHKDGNKMNPAASNLEYVTQSRNQTHACETGLKPTKLDREKAIEIRRLLSSGVRPCELAARYGVSDSTITHVKQGKSWALEDDPGEVVVTGPKTVLRRNRKSLPPKTCSECGRLSKPTARGLCLKCYMHNRRYGTLPPL